MSAYIVDRKHIEYLVQSGLARALHPDHSYLTWIWNLDREARTYCRADLKPGDHEQAQRVGQMLWDECIKSVSSRYPADVLTKHDATAPLEQLPGPLNEDFVYRHNQARCWAQYDPIQVISACHAYSYQSCEHPEWEESEAYAYINALEKAAIHALPGYEDTVWGAPPAA